MSSLSSWRKMNGGITSPSLVTTQTLRYELGVKFTPIGVWISLQTDINHIEIFVSDLPVRMPVCTSSCLGVTSSGVMVSKLDFQTFTSEFESHCIPHSFDLVPYRSKKLRKLQQTSIFKFLNQWIGSWCWFLHGLCPTGSSLLHIRQFFFFLP